MCENCLKQFVNSETRWKYSNPNVELCEATRCAMFTLSLPLADIYYSFSLTDAARGAPLSRAGGFVRKQRIVFAHTHSPQSIILQNNAMFVLMFTLLQIL